MPDPARLYRWHWRIPHRFYLDGELVHEQAPQIKRRGR